MTKKALIWVICLLALLSTITATNYFNITETFNDMSYHNSSALVYNSKINYTVLSPYNRTDIEFGIIKGQGAFNFSSQPINASVRNDGALGFIVNNSLSSESYGFYYIHLKGCDHKNCFLTRASIVQFENLFGSFASGNIDQNNKIEFVYLSNLTKTNQNTSSLKLIYRTNEDSSVTDACYIANSPYNFGRLGANKIFNVNASDLGYMYDNWYSTNYGGIRQNCSRGFNITNPFNYIVFGFSDSTLDDHLANVKFKIDNLTVLNILNGSNSLPQVTFTASTDACYDDRNISIYRIPITLNVSCIDPDGDTCLYSMNVDENDIYTQGQFETSLDGVVEKICTPIRIWPFSWLFNWTLTEICSLPQASITLVAPVSDFINYNSCVIGNNSEFPIVTKLNNKGDNVEMLMYWINCDKQRETYLNLKSDLGWFDDITYVSNLYPVIDSGQSFNVTLYNDIERNEIVARIRMTAQNSTTFNVYNERSGSSDLLGSFSPGKVSGQDYGVVNPLIDYDFSQNKFNLSIAYDTGTFNIGNLSGYDYAKVTKYVGISISQDNLYQEAYMYGGSVFTANWSEAIPGEVNILTRGKEHVVTLFYTDSFNAGNIFGSAQYTLNIENCQYKGDSISEIPANEFGIFGQIQSLLGGSLLYYLRSLGYEDEAKNLLWIMFIILIIFFLVVGYFTTRIVNITFPIIASSLICLWVAFLCIWPAHIIVFIIFLALGIASPFARQFIGGSDGR